MPEYKEPKSNHPNQRPRALIVAVQRPRESESEVESSCIELERLAATLGIEIVGCEIQKRSKTTSSTYLGPGKIAEIKESLLEGIDIVLVDGELSRSQQRNLERELEVEVFDRTAVILRIFEERAQTREAHLEIEIARLQYEMPKLRDEHAGSGGDGGGGGGRGGRGHTGLELSKQQRRDRRAALKRELAEVQATEAVRRERRRETFQVALVGYTNAGKSSLMRALTGSEVLVEDKLFATLGTTVRQLSPQVTPQILVSDTVGFIKNLPTELVASFRSTLDEAKDARFLLFVVDASDPDWRSQLALTQETIYAIGASKIPSKIILNKADRLDDVTPRILARDLPDAIQLSAHNPDDVLGLRKLLIAAQDESMSEETLLVPFTAGQILGEVHAVARIIEETHTESGTALKLRARAEALDRWRSMLGHTTPVETVDQLLEIARTHGLELTSDQSDFDNSGLDFKVVHAEDADARPWIVRTPRRPDVFAASRVEARALRLVRAHLPVAVPDFQLLAGQAIAYPTLAGTPAWRLEGDKLHWNIINPKRPSAVFLESLAKALVALQAIPGDEILRADLPIESIAEARESLRRMALQTRHVLNPSEAVWTRWQSWLDDEDGYWPTSTTLVHGDLHPGHLLLNADGQLTGILDWTEARQSDPTIDFAGFLGCFGHHALDALLTQFEDAGGHIWARIEEQTAERWAFNAVVIAAWGLTHDNPGVIAHARAQLASVKA
ncbi:MAG: GTPase HflX [Bradymonadaceae bacterium]|nr:GTPase HflX [Lujinxingiaceae bacterium]